MLPVFITAKSPLPLFAKEGGVNEVNLSSYFNIIKIQMSQINFIL